MKKHTEIKKIFYNFHTLIILLMFLSILLLVLTKVFFIGPLLAPPESCEVVAINKEVSLEKWLPEYFKRIWEGLPLEPEEPLLIERVQISEGINAKNMQIYYKNKKVDDPKIAFEIFKEIEETIDPYLWKMFRICYDSDGNNKKSIGVVDYYAEGLAEGRLECSAFIDKCQSETQAVEYYCEEGRLMEDIYNCEFGCINLDGKLCAECGSDNDCREGFYCKEGICESALDFCGDGKINTEYGEECDEKSNNGESKICDDVSYEKTCDYCSTECRLIQVSGGFCGNGNHEKEYEECDKGVENGDSTTICEAIPYGEACKYCDTNCTEKEANFCDDFIIQSPYEECDDGPKTEEGGNGAECKPGYLEYCTYCSTECINKIEYGGECGDSIVQKPEEECDDGNSVNGDGCDESCVLEFCGDSHIDLGEECDDGNSVNGDGCDESCVEEVCGNGIEQIDEECDEGVSNTNIECVADYSEDCTYCDKDCILNIVNGGFCGDSEIQIPNEECDDGNSVNGDGCDENCQTETIINEDGGGGGGDRNSNIPISEEDYISTTPSEISLSVTKNIVDESGIVIRNSLDRDVSITLIGENLDGVITFDKNSLKIPAKGQANVILSILAKNEGLIAGKILIQEDSVTELEIPTVIMVSGIGYLFDAQITIDESSLYLGDELVSQISLLQVGEQVKLDVTANYVLKDFEGNVYDEESETLAVEGRKDYTKRFSTEGLPPGEYVLGLEIIYPDEFATSSDRFRIIERETEFKWWWIIAISAVILFVVAYFILKLRKKRSKYNKKRRLRK